MPNRKLTEKEQTALGCMGCAGLVVLGIICLGCGGMFLSWRTKSAVLEAHNLYQQGKQAEAVTAYKGLYADAGADRPAILKRIVEYEVSQAHTREATQSAERGVQDKAEVASDDPATQRLA